MRFSFVTIHPEFISSYLRFGVFSSATKSGACSFDVINLRDFAVDHHGSIDDRAYGGGDGMVMRPEPLARAVEHIRQESPNAKVVFPSPQGLLWKHSLAEDTVSKGIEHLVFICGRFGGIDQRFIDLYVDLQFSLGDFVLSGGELASLSIGDSLLRLIPGVLGNKDSSLNDSFAEGNDGLLEAPQYTRPPVFEGKAVPEVLMQGNHKLIKQWRQEQSKQVTERLRPDLLD